MAETRLSTVRYDTKGVLGLAESKTVNRPVLKVGLVVIAMYFPSELVTGVPADRPSTAAVVKASVPSAMFSTVTYALERNGGKSKQEIVNNGKLMRQRP